MKTFFWWQGCIEGPAPTEYYKEAPPVRNRPIFKDWKFVGVAFVGQSCKCVLEFTRLNWKLGAEELIAIFSHFQMTKGK
jgi:hypothetical protein